MRSRSAPPSTEVSRAARRASHLGASLFALGVRVSGREETIAFRGGQGPLTDSAALWARNGAARRSRLHVQDVQRAPFVYLPLITSSPLTVSEARRQLASIIDRARSEHEPVYLARRGRRVAAVIDADDLDRVLDLAEDMADIRAAEAARAEMRETAEAPIPWEQVKADLGLT